MIKFLDLKKVNDAHGAEISAAIQRVLDSGWYLLGEEVSNFEQEFAVYCGTKQCIGVANGLDALILILMGYRAGKAQWPSSSFCARQRVYRR